MSERDDATSAEPESAPGEAAREEGAGEASTASGDHSAAAAPNDLTSRERAEEASPSMGTRSPRRGWLAAMLLVLFAAAFIWRATVCGDEAGPGGSSDEVGSGTDGAAEAPRSEGSLHGRLLLEAQPDPGGESRPAGDGAEQGSEGGESVAGELRPPELGTCTALAWQDARPVAPPAPCAVDGRFTLALDAGTTGTVAVEMLVPGRLRGFAEIEVGAGGELDLPTVAVGIGFTLAGKTVDARGEPLAGVTVQAMPSPNLGESEPWRATSREDGTFAFETLPHGRVNLRAIKDGYSLSVVEALSPESEVLVVLEALIDLEGTVVGDPELLARARLRLEGSSLWPPMEQPIGGDGGFRVQALPDGIYAIEILVPPSATDPREWASLPLENVTPELGIGLALIEAQRVKVRVIDPEGHPVPGARVTLGYSSVGLLQKQAECDAEGRARVGPVVPGPYLVRADADGFLPAEPVEIVLEPRADGQARELEEQTLVLVRPARIEGVVVDEADRPVAGALVTLDGEGLLSFGASDARAQLFALDVHRAGSLGTTTSVPDIPLFEGVEEAPEGVYSDDDGRFVIEGLAPGTFGLRALHGEHAASPLLSFELHSGEVRSGVRLRLREGFALTGVTRTTNGQPVPFARIELEDGTILLADDRGVFDAGLRRGKESLVVRARGMVPQRVLVDLRQHAVDLEIELLAAEGRLEGRARDAADRPIEGVEVSLRMLDGLSPTEIEWTDARGVFEFDALSLGDGVLDLHHRDFVDVELGARISTRIDVPLEIELVRGWAVEVEVRAAGSGEPIAGASVDAGATSGRSDSRGLVTLDHLWEEETRIEVSASGWVSASTIAQRDASGLTRVRVELEEAGGIEGSVVDERGEPVAGAEIRAVDPATGETLVSATTRAGGGFELAGVRAGLVRLEVSPPRTLSAVLAPIEVDTDVLRGTVTRDLRLRFDRL